MEPKDLLKYVAGSVTEAGKCGITMAALEAKVNGADIEGMTDEQYQDFVVLLRGEKVYWELVARASRDFEYHFKNGMHFNFPMCCVLWFSAIAIGGLWYGLEINEKAALGGPDNTRVGCPECVGELE